jgi:diguanylate cyclase (GGDEF)-like protein
VESRRVCAAALTLLLSAAAPLRPTLNTQLSLWGRVDTLRDPSGRMTFEQVRAPAAYWIRDSDDGLHASTRLTPSVRWYRLRVEPGQMGKYAILVSWHALAVTLYVPRPDGSVETLESGGYIPAVEKPFFHAQNLLPLPPQALTGQPIYLRVRSSFERSSVFLLLGWAAWQNMLYGWEFFQHLQLLFAGFLTAFSVLSVLLAVRLRRTPYVLYSIAVLSAVLQVLVLTGDAWWWIWPRAGIDYDLAQNGSYALAIGFAALFGRSLLQTRRRFPRFDALLISLLATFFAANAMLIVDPERLVAFGVWDSIEVIVTALVLLPLAACAAFAAANKDRGALLYLLAVAGVLAGNVTGVAANNLLLPRVTLTYIAPTLGFAFEALLLAFALFEQWRMVERDAYLDPLTRLVNRRGLEDALAAEREHAARTLSPYSVLMLDIDYFKKYNDRYGHLQGDRVLTLVANAFARALRGVDCAARYGGEEFIALLPGTAAEGALVLGERVRAAVRALAIEHADAEEGIVTVSIGAACARDAESDASLLMRADAALYAAKNGGRNRVALASV